jgi:FixJ family two-component response regulator
MENRVMGAEGTVFIVDDDSALRKSLGRLLDSVGVPHVGFRTADEFLETYAAAPPGCLVLDVRMPGTSGLELQRQLAGQGVDIPIIIITGHGDVPMAADAMRRGAVDFLEKPVPPQVLLDRIHQALVQDAENRRNKAEHEAIIARLAGLTGREREVVERAVTGMTNKRIAAQLGVSPQAIDAHRAKAMDKLGVGSVAELVQLMMRVDAIPPTPADTVA